MQSALFEAGSLEIPGETLTLFPISRATVSGQGVDGYNKSSTPDVLMAVLKVLFGKGCVTLGNLTLFNVTLLQDGDWHARPESAALDADKLCQHATSGLNICGENLNAMPIRFHTLTAPMAAVKSSSSFSLKCSRTAAYSSSVTAFSGNTVIISVH